MAANHFSDKAAIELELSHAIYQTKKCPKCGSEMKPEDYLSGYVPVRLIKFGDMRGDKVIPFYCENCGYIELYNQKNLRK